ncbi:hypothetical protein [Enterococcus wangshanyuanii]
MASSDELLTMESFLFICKEIGLSIQEMELMDIGQCLDYIQEWIDEKTSDDDSGKRSAKKRKATQADFDAF